MGGKGTLRESGATRSAKDCTYDLGLLSDSLQKWESSRGLRVVYESFFAQIMAATVGDRVLEVGAGIGVLKRLFPRVVTSDVKKTEFVDEALSCYAIEEGRRAWSSIVALDVLHHLTEPMRFLASAAASLEPGGRLVLSDPAATCVGRWFYRVCHHEPCRPTDLTVPFRFEPDDADGSFANMGMAMALFVQNRDWLDLRLNELGMKVVSLRFSELIAYPLSGGFSKPQLVPTALLQFLLNFERHLPQWLLRSVALRMLIILEKER